jgi:Cu(I)/Ag(I) efflux system membrane protein CusA/SilA
LNYIRDGLPDGVDPHLGPDANGLGCVYEYYLKIDPATAPNGGYDLGELRAIQDWNVRFELNAIPGVADVGSLGGFVRQYQVEANPNRLRQLGLTLRDLMDAFERGNLSVGGKTIDEGGREFVVRGVGRLQTVNAIENLVVRSGAAGTIRVRDAARVQLRRLSARALMSMATKLSAGLSSCARRRLSDDSGTNSRTGGPGECHSAPWRFHPTVLRPGTTD